MAMAPESFRQRAKKIIGILLRIQLSYGKNVFSWFLLIEKVAILNTK
jgi:hypothetical protein